jgi:T-complex protein 1 subunit eta
MGPRSVMSLGRNVPAECKPFINDLPPLARRQDSEAGGGTTSVMCLAVDILNHMKPFVEEGVHPQIIIHHVRAAVLLTVAPVRFLAVHFDLGTPKGKRMLVKTASTVLNSKLSASHQDLSAPMVVDVARYLAAAPGSLDDLRGIIAIKRIPGGDVR